jgi:hypothetical protein
MSIKFVRIKYSGDFIRRSMSKIMDDEVYKLYNWEGRKGRSNLKT